MSDTPWFAVCIFLAFVVGFFSGGIGADATAKNYRREKFLTFCTDQNIPYAQCKEEWSKP
jgi:hypothetical protein